MAPLAAIDAVEAATKLSFEDGCREEQRLFIECLQSDQSKALIHVFFGEREVAKIPDVPKETPTIPVNNVAVVGAGTMGGGIAMVFANAGIPVLLKESDQAALDRGLANIQKNYASSVKRGRFTQQFVDERLKLIRPTLQYDGFEKADMVVEAVFEGMALKKQVFAELDRVCKPGAILASNTSTLNIDEIASTHIAAGIRHRHSFFQSGQRDAPARNRPREEDQQAGDRHMHAALEEDRKDRSAGRQLPRLCWQPNVRSVRARIRFPGRGGRQRRGGGPARLLNSAWRMGPLAVGDLAGLDVGWRIRKEYRHLEKPGVRQPMAGDRLCEMGRFGQKTRARVVQVRREPARHSGP